MTTMLHAPSTPAHQQQELKQACKDRGLTQQGCKAVLLERLLASLPPPDAEPVPDGHDPSDDDESSDESSDEFSDESSDKSSDDSSSSSDSDAESGPDELPTCTYNYDYDDEDQAEYNW
jgi:hypothetical protein